MNDLIAIILAYALWIAIAVCFQIFDCLWPITWRVLRQDPEFKHSVPMWIICLNWWFVVVLDVFSTFMPASKETVKIWRKIKNEGID